MGNKSDLLPHVINEAEIIELAKETNSFYYLVSAHKDINIKEAFKDMALQLKKKFYL